MPFGSEKFPANPSSEQKVADDLLDRVAKQLGLQAKITIDEIKEKDSTIKAYRIILNKREVDGCAAVLVSDWDDTLERYTERKKLYWLELIKLFLSQNENLYKKDLLNFFKSINKTARCLPSDGTSPESYSPYLEMLIESYCLEILKSRPEEFKRMLKLDRENLRQLFKKRAIPLSISDLIEDVIKEKEENGKTVKKSYFKPVRPLVLEINLKVKPPLIRQDIWNLFVKQMTGSNLSSTDATKMSLNEDVYWAISSFGSANFQVEKILAGLQELQKNGQRLPDEIVIVTQGRKKPFLLKFLGELGALGQKKILYLDDSTSQLKLMTDVKDKIKSIWALVRGSDRAKKAREVLIGQPEFEIVDLEKTALQALVDQNLMIPGQDQNQKEEKQVKAQNAELTHAKLYT